MQQPIKQMPTAIAHLKAAAVAHALAGDWMDAVAVNRELLAADRSDVEAYNRLGKSLMELDRNAEAIEAYRAALKLNRHNRIARRNLERLEQAGGNSPAGRSSAPSAEMRRAMSAARGASITTPLVRCASSSVLAAVAKGERLELSPSAGGMRVTKVGGDYLGVIEPRLSRRIVKLIEGGNRYEATSEASTDGVFSVYVAEVYKSPGQAQIASFPPRFGASNAELGNIDKYDFSGDDVDSRRGDLGDIDGEADGDKLPAQDTHVRAMLSGRT